MRSLLPRGLSAICLWLMVGELFRDPVRAENMQVGIRALPLVLSRLFNAPAGTSVDWSALRGRVVVLEFWGVDCPYCVAAIPHWNELADRWQDRGVVFLAITSDNADLVTRFLKRHPIHSWVGVEGVGQSNFDSYGIRGIPASVLVNQKGVVVGRIHPALLKSEDLAEVLRTGRSSLSTRRGGTLTGVAAETVALSASPPLYDVSIRRSGPVPKGHGIDCWSFRWQPPDVHGEFASVQSAIRAYYQTRDSRLRILTRLPDGRYDFRLQLPAGGRSDVQQVFARCLRDTFGLASRWTNELTDVLVLSVANSNARGLVPAGLTRKTSLGSNGSGRLDLQNTRIAGLLGYLENWLGKPVVDETGLTDTYDLRLRWHMVGAEALPWEFDENVLRAVGGNDAEAWRKLPEPDRGIAAAIEGQLDVRAAPFAPALQRRIGLMRAELAKPPDRQFQPDPVAVRQAVAKELGLRLAPARRRLRVLVVVGVRQH